MRSRRRALCALLGGLAAAALALAAGPAAGASSADDAAAEVRERTGERILEVRLVERGGARAWRVKVLLDGGRVRVYYVDLD